MSSESLKITKVNPDVLHFLPFSPSRTRKKGFSVSNVFGDERLTVNAVETMNHTDLIVFAQLINDYAINPDKWVEAGIADGRQLIKGTLDIHAMTKERMGNTDKNNRITTTKCFDRIMSIKLEYLRKNGNTVKTWYVSSVEYEKDHSEVTIVANKKFMDTCIDSGMLLDYGRLIKYGSDGYAALLDAYIQGIKRRTPDGQLKYKSTFYHDDICKILSLDETKLRPRDKMSVVKNTFKTLHKIGGLPQYEYVKMTKQWVRSDEIETIRLVK